MAQPVLADHVYQMLFYITLANDVTELHLAKIGNDGVNLISLIEVFRDVFTKWLHLALIYRYQFSFFIHKEFGEVPFDRV